MPNLTVLDLFSGIAGISYGLEATGGFRTVAFCEIDPFCRLVLEKHWPNVPIWEDVRELSAESVRGRCGRIDIIAGGFPCQPHSVAGKRGGQSDERHLWPEFARLVREIRPRWVLAENVPGIRSTAADEVIGDLADLQTLTRDDLYNHYRTFYVPNNAILAIAGDFETQQMLSRPVRTCRSRRIS